MIASFLEFGVWISSVISFCLSNSFGSKLFCVGWRFLFAREFLFNALQVELELFALKQVAVGTTALAWRRGDASEHSARREVLLELWVDLGRLSSLDVLLQGLLGALLVQDGLVRLSL